MSLYKMRMCRNKQMHESTHPIMHRLILSWFGFTGAGEAMCRCIAAWVDTYQFKNEFFLYSTLFSLSSHYHSMWL